MDNSADLYEAVYRFASYNDYLDSMATKDDLEFLLEESTRRELVKLECRSNKPIISEEQFDKKKAAIEAGRTSKRVIEKKLCSTNKNIQGPLMQELAKREEGNIHNKFLTIIFLRNHNARGEEESAYIDYSARLHEEDWEVYFEGKKKLVPLPTDLSYYNWKKAETLYTSSLNFEVVLDYEKPKLIFVCKKDGISLDLNSKSFEPGGAVTRSEVENTNYNQVVLFDHIFKQ